MAKDKGMLKFIFAWDRLYFNPFFHPTATAIIQNLKPGSYSPPGSSQRFKISRSLSFYVRQKHNSPIALKKYSCWNNISVRQDIRQLVLIENGIYIVWSHLKEKRIRVYYLQHHTYHRWNSSPRCLSDAYFIENGRETRSGKESIAFVSLSSLCITWSN